MKLIPVVWLCVSCFSCFSGCASTLAPPTGDLRLDLKHEDPRIRIDATLKAVSESRIELAELLIANLSDRDGAVRLFSSVALRKLTGRDCGYKPHGTEAEREESISCWRSWLEMQKARSATPEPPFDP